MLQRFLLHEAIFYLLQRLKVKMYFYCTIILQDLKCDYLAIIAAYKYLKHKTPERVNVIQESNIRTTRVNSGMERWKSLNMFECGIISQ